MAERETTIVTVHDLIYRNLVAHEAPYYEWLKHLSSLASMALSLSVALQAGNLPTEPRAIWAIGAAWMLLATSVVAALLALKHQYQARLQTATDLNRLLNTEGEEAAVEHVLQGYCNRKAPPSHRWAARLAAGCFLLAMPLLAGFALANLPP